MAFVYPTKSLQDLPHEILMGILIELLKMPEGIHLEDWESTVQSRIEPLVATTLVSLVPEALYKHNKVIVSFETRTLYYMYSESTTTTCIRYPPTSFNHWVRELEIHISKQYSPYANFRFQVEWLKRLGGGTIGFQKLRKLILVFDCPVREDRRTLWDKSDLEAFRLQLRNIGKIVIPVDRLVIQAGSHCCERDGCSTDARFGKPQELNLCYWVAEIREYFALSG